MAQQIVGDTVSAASPNKYWRFAVWIAIGALIAAAIVCVVWVLVGTQNGIVPRAFLTVLLLTAFAGVTVAESSVATRKPQWYTMLSMIGWVLVLLAGAVKIWAPQADLYWDGAGTRIVQFLLIVLIVRLAILHVWLYLRAHTRRPTAFNNVAVGVTIGLVAVLSVLLIVPLVFSGTEFSEFYWRLVVAVTILAAVGTAIAPLVRALLLPRPDRPVPQPYGAQSVVAPVLLPWPMFADGITPLPALADGTPDFGAYARVQQPAVPAVTTTITDPNAGQWAADQVAAAQAAQAAWSDGQVGAPVAPMAGAATTQVPPVPPIPPLPPQ